MADPRSPQMDIMASRKKSRGHRSAHVDLDLFAGPNLASTKTTQPCHQVQEAISCALVFSANPLLRDLSVVRVEPLQGSALLRVLVCTEGELDERTFETLEKASGYFRSQVAQEISRKRVPSLRFTLIPAHEAPLFNEERNG